MRYTLLGSGADLEPKTLRKKYLLEETTMSKIVARMEKMKAGNLGGIQRHNQRETDNHSNKDIATERSHLNYDLVNPKAINYQNQIHKIIDEQRLSQRAIRKDAVLVDEWIITSDRPFFESLSDSKSFFEDSLEYFSERCGSQNIAYATVHLDETTPHMHLGIVPMHEGRLSSKHVFSRQTLKEIQDELPNYLQSRGHDIERGIKGSEQKHLTVEEYKENQSKIAEYKEQVTDLEQQCELLEGEKDYLLEEKKETLSKLKQDNQQMQKQLTLINVNHGATELELQAKLEQINLIKTTNAGHEWFEKYISPNVQEKNGFGGTKITMTPEGLAEMKQDIIALYDSSQATKNLNTGLQKEVKEMKSFVSNRVNEMFTIKQELEAENRRLVEDKKELSETIDKIAEDVDNIIFKSEVFMEFELGLEQEKRDVYKAYLGKGESLNYAWERLKPISQKISDLADKLLAKISEYISMPKAVSFVKDVIEKIVDKGFSL